MLHESTQNTPATTTQTPLSTQYSNPNLSAQIEAEQKVLNFWHETFGNLTTLIHKGHEKFIGSEVLKVLEYRRNANTLARFCKERVTLKPKELRNLYGNIVTATIIKNSPAGVTLITRNDLFKLIKHSKMRQADAFWEWITQHVLPALQDTGSYTMVTHPAAQSNQAPALASDTSLILKEMSAMVMNILQTVTESNLKMQESMQHNLNTTLARIENSNQNLQSAFSQTVMGVTTQIQNTIKEASPESKWAYQGSGPLSTTQVARILGTTSVRLNTIMDREGLITPNDTNKCWLITNKGYPFCYTQGYAQRPKKYVINMRWDMSLVEYLRFNVAEFKRA